ncbi:hypothetical protein ANO14919_038900 [Xylariales sp. No.14919]|nr:hypothetical protein ANO14919_038900 [Xylariales sp. No.14919]
MSYSAPKRALTTGPASAGLRLVANKGKQAMEWAATNPGKTAALSTGVVLVAVPMAVAAPALGLVGFGANGVVAGSAAAGIQGGIGSVAAGSAFATLQSAAAGGYGVAAVSAAVQGVGGVVASVGAFSVFKKKQDQGGDDAGVEKDGQHALREKADEGNAGNENDEVRG